VRILGWKKETAVIYNGLDLKQIDLGKLPDKLVNKNKIYFLSRLVRWKRPEMFVRAATQIHSEIPETEFVIFGKGPKEAVLADMIKNSSASQFLKRGGWVYHFSDLLSSFGIFVLTSYEEPFGRAVVEAVIRGKVVVVPKSGAMPEIFVGYDLLFERDDFADLIKKIRIAYFHYDHYHKQVLRLRKDFLKIYNMERVRQEYLAAYLLDL
jgi:glycosyltransferase involved in cell wall biosynthesis